MKTWIPQQDAVRLAYCDPDEIVYYPISRKHWVLLRWAWSLPTDNGTRITCEVLAEGLNSYGVGRLLNLPPETQIYQLNEMEILALAAS